MTLEQSFIEFLKKEQPVMLALLRKPNTVIKAAFGFLSSTVKNRFRPESSGHQRSYRSPSPHFSPES